MALHLGWWWAVAEQLQPPSWRLEVKLVFALTVTDCDGLDDSFEVCTAA